MIFVFKALLFIALAGCSKQSVHANNPGINMNDSTVTGNPGNDTTPNPGNYTFLALGDSYTIGQSVSEEARFPAQAAGILGDDGYSIDEPTYIAVTGWTTQNLLDGIASQNPKGPFDIVTLLIGVNDQYQHLDTAGYRVRFTECLQKAMALAVDKDHVFVLSIPDYSVTPFGQNGNPKQTSKEIDEFNTINKAITLSYGISYTDITPSSREAGNDPSLIASDGLHPSGSEYSKWAALLVPEIEKVLK